MNVQLLDHNRASEIEQSRAARVFVSSIGFHFDQLARELGVTSAQSGQWHQLVAALELDARQLQIEKTSSPSGLDQVFGALEQRLAKLSMIQAAAARFLDVLEPHQRQSAKRLLPFCCHRAH